MEIHIKKTCLTYITNTNDAFKTITNHINQRNSIGAYVKNGTKDNIYIKENIGAA